MKLGTILVPLDGSALAEAALPRAVELAEVSGARMVLLRAAHACPGWIPPNPGQDVHEAEPYVALIQDRPSRRRGVKVDTSVWHGPAAHAIVEAARIHKVDEIVMTTHGRSGLGRLLLSSVAESVPRHHHTDLAAPAEGAPGQPPSGTANAWEGE